MMWRLARWLGPWASTRAMPSGVTRESVEFPGPKGTQRVLIVRPRGRSAQGRLFVLHGLHFLGPEDPRMMRFLSILANARIEVFAPFIPSAMSLRLDEIGLDESAAAFEFVTSRNPGPPLSVFTISFGAILGLHLATNPRFAGRHGDLMLFGAYSDWLQALRFSLSERDLSAEPVPPDPLNQPALYLNLVDNMKAAPADTRPLMDAWRRYIEGTWGDPLMKQGAQHEPVAAEIASTLSPEERQLFLRGCGLAPGSFDEVESALIDAKERLSWLDPEPALRRLRCALHIVHGADDDVIPVSHAGELVAMAGQCAEVHAWVTGLYGHSEGAGLGGLVHRGPGALRELQTMLGLLRAIARLSHARP